VFLLLFIFHKPKQTNIDFVIFFFTRKMSSPAEEKKSISEQMPKSKGEAIRMSRQSGCTRPLVRFASQQEPAPAKRTTEDNTKK